MPKLAYTMEQINPYLQIFVCSSLRVFIETMLVNFLGRFGESDPYIYVYIWIASFHAVVETIMYI